MRYGPLDVDLQPQDQLRPLLPTWNPPPTRPPRPEELELSTRLRMLKEERWWAATVREVGDEQVKVGYDGWPSRHDEWVPRDSNRLYLHESVHPEYVAPPTPQRYQRQVPTDEEGNPLPATPRPPRPKVYDPEKERLKRALRPPLPYNPEKERLKRLLRGQYAPPIEEPQRDRDREPIHEEEPEQPNRQPEPSADLRHVQPVPEDRVPEQRRFGLGEPAAASTAAPAVASPTATSSSGSAAAAGGVEWVEVPGGVEGARAFRHSSTGELIKGKPPSGWVELIADGGQRYYWHVTNQVTQWERPQ